jgi:hypothetical protein
MSEIQTKITNGYLRGIHGNAREKSWFSGNEKEISINST